MTDDPTASCVLIVDDDPMMLELMERYLRKEDITPVTALGGKDALQHLSSLGTAVKLIFLDLAMPEISGYQIASAIRTDPVLWQVPIIAVTARSGPDVAQAMASAGIREVITKPFPPRIIRDALVYHGILDQ